MSRKNRSSERTNGQATDHSQTEQVNIRIDREFYGTEEIEHPEETTVPFVNRNQS